MKKYTSDPESIRQLATGTVIGSLERNNVHCWRGIPYAKPPIGKLRWRAPQPLPTWGGVFQALSHGSFAPQYAGLLTPTHKRNFGKIVGSEDCLHLSVYAPASSPKKVPKKRDLRPVMVWIHGGGHSVGSCASYDVMKNYAHDGVITVGINYRLGILGWFRHPSLEIDEGITAEERSGNFAILDLIAALEWVQNNISAFGGDPENVTIFGQSAGGQMVLSLLASPLAHGLFHKAISQSPVARTYSTKQAVEPNESAIQAENATSISLSEKLKKKFGKSITSERKWTPHETSTFLRSLPASDLLSVFTPGTVGIYLAPRPIRDGVVLPKEPFVEVFKGNDWNKVPIIIGSNRDEHRTFMADKSEHTTLYFGSIPVVKNRKKYRFESDFFSRAWRATNVDSIVEAMFASGHKEIWTYRFDWSDAPKIPLIRPDLLLGAAHGMEIPFIFRDINGEFDIFKVNTPFNRSGRTHLANCMTDLWISFSYGGRPVSETIEWPMHRELNNEPLSLIFNKTKSKNLEIRNAQESIKSIEEELIFLSQNGTDEALSLFYKIFYWSPLYSNIDSQNPKFLSTEQAKKFQPSSEI